MTNIDSLNRFPSFFNRLLNPEDSLHKYLALCFICMLAFGNNFSYDSPGALEVSIESVMGVGTNQFASLYALYSWPNIVMCLLGGILVDKYLGLRLAAIVFNFILIIGMLIVAYGAFSGAFWVMQVGRFIYGIGGESIFICQNTYLIKWFKNEKINSVFGINSAFLRLPSILVYNSLQPIFSMLSGKQSVSPQQTLGLTLLVPVMACTLSLICALILAYIDWRADEARKVYEARIEATVLTISDSFMSEDVVETQNFDLGVILKFKFPYWLLVLSINSFFVAIFPFVALGPKFFKTKWHYETAAAERLDSLVFIVSLLCSPLVGFIVDKLGRNLMFLLAADLLLFTSHLLMGFTLLEPLIPIIMIGLGLTITAIAPLPLIARLAPGDYIGTAFGTQQAIQNLLLASISSLGGAIVDSCGYLALEEFFLICAGSSLVLVVGLILYDLKHDHRDKLNLAAM